MKCLSTIACSAALLLAGSANLQLRAGETLGCEKLNGSQGASVYVGNDNQDVSEFSIPGPIAILNFSHSSEGPSATVDFTALMTAECVGTIGGIYLNPECNHSSVIAGDQVGSGLPFYDYFSWGGGVASSGEFEILPGASSPVTYCWVDGIVSLIGFPQSPNPTGSGAVTVVSQLGNFVVTGELQGDKWSISVVRGDDLIASYTSRGMNVVLLTSHIAAVGSNISISTGRSDMGGITTGGTGSFSINTSSSVSFSAEAILDPNQSTSQAAIFVYEPEDEEPALLWDEP